MRLGLKGTLKLSKPLLIFCISKQYHHITVNLFHEKKSPMGIIIEQASSCDLDYHMYVNALFENKSVAIYRGLAAFV